VKILIQERIMATEAAKASIIVSPQEVADRLAAIKKGLNLTDQDFEKFLIKNGTSLADFTRQTEQELLSKKLIEHGTQRGLKKEAWVNALMERAQVEILR
jgi:hypothetical protein